MKKFTLFIVLLITLCGAIALSAQSEITQRSDFFDNIRHAIPMDDGNFLVLNQRYPEYPEVYIMDENLSRIASFESELFSVWTPIYVIEGIALGTDNSFFVMGWSGHCDYQTGEGHLIKIDLNGNGIIWEQTFEYTSLDYYSYDFNNLLQTGPDGGVWSAALWVLYDSTGNEIDGAGYPSSDWSDSYAAVTSDDQYIYAATATNPVKLLKLDHDLQLINQRDWEVGDNVKAMTADGNGNIRIIGNDYHHIYASDIGNNFNFSNENPDIGIVKILDADVTEIDWGTYDIKNSRIIVQNNGTAPVTSYEINALYSDDCPYGYCNDDVHTFRGGYTTSLLPGERDTVSFIDMYICTDEELYSDLCFYTTRPNGGVDKNRGNDRACAGFETFLPIELLSPLKAKIENRTAILTWETATETNNEGFEIQKSRDGITWEKISGVDGRGNALTPHAYTYTDENLLSGITYYRFKQLDFDGEFTYSNVVNVRRAVSSISIHPNPVKNTLYITDLNGSRLEYINVFDQTGKQVISTKTTNDAIDVSNLATGVYIVEIHMEGGILHEKIVVE